jgi:uncharacterized protein
MQVQAIHYAAYVGNLAAVEQLVEEDGRRLNAQDWNRGTPLMKASVRGHDAVVMRLLALGADVGLRDVEGRAASHWACYGNRASTLTLLLDAGALLNARDYFGRTLLLQAVLSQAAPCVAVLVDRGGDALELDVQANNGYTALHWAATHNHNEIVRLLLQLGADPTLRNINGKTPLDIARFLGRQPNVALLEPAMVEPQRPRALLKARALLDAALTVPKARKDSADKGEPPALQQHKAIAAAPAYLKRRVAEGRALPAVQVNEEGQSEKLVACVKYALGLEGGGGVHEGEGPAPQGMLKEVFIELCEMLVPKWDRANV